MTRVLIVGGGVAGPVAAMALQRAGIQAVVYQAHALTTGEEVGSYLTVASNGVDALRAIDAHTLVLEAGFPTRTNVLWSGTGRRPGAVANGGVLADGTTTHTIKRGAAVPGAAPAGGRSRHPHPPGQATSGRRATPGGST